MNGVVIITPSLEQLESKLNLLNARYKQYGESYLFDQQEAKKYREPIKKEIELVSFQITKLQKERIIHNKIQAANYAKN